MTQVVQRLGKFFSRQPTQPLEKMASYDSDSDFDDENFTETNVLLGYATKDVADDTTSQLGGHPVRCTAQSTRDRAHADSHCADMA